MRELKKYPNRRLYDLDSSQYVTTDDVRRAILGGESIRVTETTEGRDITRNVLLQILTEQEQESHEAILTNRVIEQMIRLYSQRHGHFVSSYIEQSMLLFIEHQDLYQERMQAMADQPR
ncbi:MAG: polyhydroxyalkanoate synthesis repressor PhaR [Proteobacteria bacterium]|jgi:polyhydroxyalkanoate synthesis repressor PhaR|nr:polyhydroxyalkanoate synthesis repressor PhaR [Pseudomonadota bacterium]MDA1300056.1 polyhydroxyalkanoate synthesis repressor PhaR [Pseudomonadota bacterium]